MANDSTEGADERELDEIVERLSESQFEEEDSEDRRVTEQLITARIKDAPAPASGQMEPLAKAETAQWIHIYVKAEWYLAVYKTHAKVWTTSDKKGKKRVPVPKLSLRTIYTASEYPGDSKEKRNSSYLKIDYTYTGIPGVPKSRVTATGCCEWNGGGETCLNADTTP